MLYLEDYLELIEHLPGELRDRFTDIREKDLQVQNSTENLQEKIEHFFAEAKKLKPEQRQCEYDTFLTNWSDLLEVADEKVEIASNLCEVMQKLVNRLDSDIDKFKVELEASSSSICDRASFIAGESIHMNGFSSLNGSTRASSVCSDNGILANGGHYENNLSSFGNNSSFKNSSSLHPNHKSNFQNISSNLSNSTTSYNNNKHSALSATLTGSNNPNFNSALMMYAASVHNPETKYCICRRISYSEESFIGCDNFDCKIEWYHISCVGIKPSELPNIGKWYCPTCRQNTNKK